MVLHEVFQVGIELTLFLVLSGIFILVFVLVVFILVVFFVVVILVVFSFRFSFRAGRVVGLLLIPCGLVDGPVNSQSSAVDFFAVDAFECVFGILLSSEGNKTETLELSFVLGQIRKLDLAVASEKMAKLLRVADGPGQVTDNQLWRRLEFGLAGLLTRFGILGGFFSLSGLGHFDSNASAVPMLLVENGLGLLGVVGVRQSHETESTRFLCLLINNNGCVLDGEIFRKEFGKAFVCHVWGKRSNEKRSALFCTGFLWRGSSNSLGVWHCCQGLLDFRPQSLFAILGTHFVSRCNATKTLLSN